MKDWEYYRRRTYSVAAMRWTEDTALPDLVDFCDGQVKIDDPNMRFHVYNIRDHCWHQFHYGDWVVDEEDGLIPMSHERFMRLYEQDSDGSEP